MNKFDAHVKIFEKWLLDVSLRYTGYEMKSMSWLENQNISERFKSRPYKNYRLLEYLKNDKVEFYKGNKPYKTRYDL